MRYTHKDGTVLEVVKQTAYTVWYIRPEIDNTVLCVRRKTFFNMIRKTEKSAAQ